MKTAIDIPEALLDEAQKLAQAQGITLDTLITHGLNEILVRWKGRKPFKLRNASFNGAGIQPDFKEASWTEFCDLIYIER